MPRRLDAFQSSCLVAIVLWSAVAAGCAPNLGSIVDGLRREVFELEDRIRDLERRNRDLQAQIAQLSRAGDPELAEILPHIPRVVGITIDRLSHALDTTGDGIADALVIYVRPEDARARFVPLVGALTVQAVDIAADGDARVIGRVVMGPSELSDAYRSGIMGTHYRIDVELTPSADSPEGLWEGPPMTAIVRAEFVDQLTGLTHQHDRSVDLTRPQRRRRP